MWLARGEEQRRANPKRSYENNSKHRNSRRRRCNCYLRLLGRFGSNCAQNDACIGGERANVSAGFRGHSIVGNECSSCDRGAGSHRNCHRSGELFGGATKEGRVIFLVTKGDDKVVLFYDQLFGGQTYFALK